MEISRINRALKVYKAVKYGSLVPHNGYVFITGLLFFFLPTTYRIVSLIRELGNLFVCVLICLFGGSIKTLSLMTWVDVVCYWICIKGVILGAYRYLILSFIKRIRQHTYLTTFYYYLLFLLLF